MKNIMVASDLSARSDRALQRAAQLALAHKARLTVVNIVDDDLPFALTQEITRTAKERLGQAVAATDAADAQIAVEIGATVETLLSMADKVSADLVVVGTHKPRAFWDIFSGTTVERFIRASRCPILLAEGPVQGPYASVLCGIDLSPACVAAGNLAVDLVPEADFATFHAVHLPYRGLISPGEQASAAAPFLNEANARLNAWWPKAGLSERLPKPEVKVESVYPAFEKARREVNADLFALGAHGRAALSPSLLGHFAESLIREPQCDLLIVRGGRADF